MDGTDLCLWPQDWSWETFWTMSPSPEWNFKRRAGRGRIWDKQKQCFCINLASWSTAPKFHPPQFICSPCRGLQVPLTSHKLSSLNLPSHLVPIFVFILPLQPTALHGEVLKVTNLTPQVMIRANKTQKREEDSHLVNFNEHYGKYLPITTEDLMCLLEESIKGV